MGRIPFETINYPDGRTVYTAFDATDKEVLEMTEKYRYDPDYIILNREESENFDIEAFTKTAKPSSFKLVDEDMNKLLKKLGWSQAHFSRVCGVSERTVNQWVKKPPRLPMVYLALCVRLLNV